MSGFQLLTQEQQEEMGNLLERSTHRDTMRFTCIDAVTLVEYERLCERLEKEATKE